MKAARYFFLSFAAFLVSCLYGTPAQAFNDVKSTTYERTAIAQVVQKGWLSPVSTTTFGYGVAITPQEWFTMLMFLRTDDACPELGMKPNQYWQLENIQACLSGAGVPVVTERPDQVRRDEAMQQLFALRRRAFAFQQLQTKPTGFIDPADVAEIPSGRQGAMIAGDRLKLIFRSKNKLLPASPLLREDAALAVTRLLAWEEQGGPDAETNEQIALNKETTLNHWRDLDTDIYVIKATLGGDTVIRPILPRRSFTPSTASTTVMATSTTPVRDEFVYQPVSGLAKDSGALAAINGSYFNVDWPWGPLEDVAIVDGKTYLERTDRSTFVVCKDGQVFMGKYQKAALQAQACTPQQALGAGPMFIQTGEVLTENTKEGFDEYTLWERRVGKNARTAVAISRDRKNVYLIVVAGNSYPAFGRGGATLGTFLKVKYPDIQEAMMLDGGSSSTLYAKDAVLVGAGVSGGQGERSVVSALGIFSKKADQAAATAFKKEQAKRWEAEPVTVKLDRPTVPFAWQPVKRVNIKGVTVTLSGTRGARLQIAQPKTTSLSYAFTFDLLAYDATTTKLYVARREGTHVQGWKIPTEMHVIDPKDKSDTDIIRLFAYLPEANKPDLKTFDVSGFGKTGIYFGDATGRSWFYYAKDKQLMPLTFLGKPKPLVPAKKVTDK